MLSGKDLLGQFKAAAWNGPEEVEAFLSAAEAPAPQELLKLLEVLAGKAPDAQAHRTRLGAFARLVEKNPDKSLFVPFVRALKAGDAALRTTLVALLARVNSPTEHGELVAHLRSPDAAFRQIAAPALKVIAGALDGQPEPVTLQAIVSFAQLCSEEDYWEFVSRFLDVEAVGLAKCAVEGLRRFVSLRTIAALERKLRVGPRAIRL